MGTHVGEINSVGFGLVCAGFAVHRRVEYDRLVLVHLRFARGAFEAAQSEWSRDAFKHMAVRWGTPFVASTGTKKGFASSTNPLVSAGRQSLTRSDLALTVATDEALWAVVFPANCQHLEPGRRCSMSVVFAEREMFCARTASARHQYGS